VDCSGDICPNCIEEGRVYMLSTTNELKYACEECDTRFEKPLRQRDLLKELQRLVRREDYGL